MSHFTRRAALLGAPSLLILAACGTTGSVTPAQIIADAQGVVGGLVKALGIVTAAAPKLIPPSQVATDAAGLQAAQTVLGVIAANPPPATTGQTTMQTIEGYITVALNDLAAVTPAVATLIPGLGAAVPIIQAVAVLVPIIEAFINPASATAATASLRAKALAPAMTVDEARAKLGVRVG